MKWKFCKNWLKSRKAWGVESFRSLKGLNFFITFPPTILLKSFAHTRKSPKKKKKLFSWAYLQKTHCWIKFWKSTFNLALLTFLMSVVDALHSRLLLRKLNSLVCYSRSVLLICRATEGCNRAHRVNCSVLLIPAREFSRFFAVSQFWN